MITKLFAVFAIALSVTAVHAADAPKPDAPKPGTPAADKPAKPRGLKGEVVKVEGTKVTIKTGKKADEKEVVIATDDKTVVKIDEKDAKVADLKAGLKVTISPETGTATTIIAKTPKTKKPK